MSILPLVNCIGGNILSGEESHAVAYELILTVAKRACMERHYRYKVLTLVKASQHNIVDLPVRG
jgi:hypothetical protein